MNGPYQWTTANGIHVTSDTPRRDPLTNRSRLAHLAWSYSYSLTRICADARTRRTTPSSPTPERTQP